MEDSQLQHRIILYQRIMDAWKTSVEDRSLTDIIADYTFGMTREELDKFLKESIVPNLERALVERDAAMRQTAEAKSETERERQARKKAEKECASAIKSKDEAIKSKDEEIKRLKKELEDAKNTKDTDNRNTFGSKSRKSRHSVDKNFSKSDRCREKEDFDGNEETDSSEATDSVKTEEEGKKYMTEKELSAFPCFSQGSKGCLYHPFSCRDM